MEIKAKSPNAKIEDVTVDAGNKQNKAKPMNAADDKPTDQKPAPQEAKSPNAKTEDVTPDKPKKGNRRVLKRDPKMTCGKPEVDKKYRVGHYDVLPKELRDKKDDDLFKTITLQDAKVDNLWKATAQFYGWSTEQVKRRLVEQGAWPTDKETGKPIGTVKLRDQETKAGTNGIGHWMNRASNRFAYYKKQIEELQEEEPKEKPLTKEEQEKKDKEDAAKKAENRRESAIKNIAKMTKEQFEDFMKDQRMQDVLAGHNWTAGPKN